MSANGSDEPGGGAPQWERLVRPFRLAAAALTDPAPRLVTAFVRAEDLTWLEPELEVLEFSPFGTLRERVPEPPAPEPPRRAAPASRPPARRSRAAAGAAAAAVGRAHAPPVFSFRRRAAQAGPEPQPQPRPEPDERATSAIRAEGASAPVAGAAAPFAAAAAPPPEPEPESHEVRVEPLALLEQLVDPLFRRRKTRGRGPAAPRRTQQRRRAPAPGAAGPAAPRSTALPLRAVSPFRSADRAVRETSALRTPDVAASAGAAGGPSGTPPPRGAARSAPRRARMLFPRVPSARAAAAPPPVAGEAPPAAAEPALMRLVEAVARDVPFAPRAAPLAGAAPGAAPPATSPDVGATGPGPVAAGGREPERGPKSTLLPLDLGETPPRPPRAPDGGELATLVNDALVEQARRHGVDLS